MVPGVCDTSPQIFGYHAKEYTKRTRRPAPKPRNEKAETMRAISNAVLIAGAILFVGAAYAGCFSDFDCGYGNKCVKASRDINITGVCVTPSDKFGSPRPDYSAPKPEPSKVRGCSFDTDCDIGFSCMKRNGQIYGICVK